ncbi:MAG: hypothetical protein ACT4N2_02905 [Hyphomicrobium sp.]
MIRALSLAAVLAAGSSLSALAADETAAPAVDASEVTAYTAQLTTAAQATQVRNLLQAQGYTGITGLERDETGRWVGAAVKDGKSMGVAVVLPPKGSAPAATN